MDFVMWDFALESVCQKQDVLPPCMRSSTYSLDVHKVNEKVQKYSQYFIDILFMVQRPLTKLLARSIEIINWTIFNNIKYSFN